MPDKPHGRLAAYARWIVGVNPLVAEARLHVVAPVALVLIVVLLIGAAVRPVARRAEDAGTLVAGATNARYAVLDERLVALNRQQGQGAAAESADERAIKAEMMRLAVGAKLRGCTKRVAGVSCDGRGTKDPWIFVFYAAGVLFVVMAVIAWVSAVYSTSWVLPYHNPSLWYTPLYGAAIALLTASPLLMARLYFERVDADYQLPAARSAMPTPSLLLYVLLVLQVTAVVVAVIKARTPLASMGRWAGPPAISIVVAGYSALFLSGTTWLIVCVVILGVGLVVGPVRAMLTVPKTGRGREHGPPRILQLSAVLLIAWFVFALDVILGADGMVHKFLIALCFIACATQVLLSRALELTYGPR